MDYPSWIYTHVNSMKKTQGILSSNSLLVVSTLGKGKDNFPLRVGSSDNKMGQVFERLQVQITMETKNYLSKKR